MKDFQVALYIRLSCEDGDRKESESVCNQKKILMEYICGREEFVLYDIYIDDGFSGTNFNRPGFQRMISDIEKKRVNCVIVKDLSRFGRDYIETGRYLERIFPNRKVRFISVAEHMDSLKREYDLLLPIKNIFNEQYARDISDKIQQTLKTKQKEGEFIGAFASYGYKKSPLNKNQLIIDTYAAEVVRKIFSLYMQGMGKQSIAKTLNEDGVLCPSEYKKMNGEKYKNGNRLQSTCYWTYSTVNAILRNEMYIGNMVQGKKHQRMRGRQQAVEKENWVRVEHTHEAIIDNGTWELVQNLLQKKQRTIEGEKNKNIFAGLLQCGDCGRAMVKNCWKRADGSEVYMFYCGTYKRNGREYCTPHSLSFQKLNEILLKDLREILESVENLQELILQSIAKGNVSESMYIERKKLQIELETVKKRQFEVYEDYKENLFTREEFASYREKYQQKEKYIQKQLETLRRKEKVTELLCTQRIRELKEIEELDREMVVELIDKIIVYDDRKIKIIYNFSLSKLYTFNEKK